jgi:outer membrane protein assembly factor BamA
MRKLASTFLLLISLGAITKAQETNEVICVNIPANDIKNFNIRRVVFTGIPHIRDRVMRRAFNLIEGDTFTFKLLSRGVKGLNQLGLFYKIVAKDITCAVLKDQQEIDFTVYLRELPQHKRRYAKDRKSLFVK